MKKLSIATIIAGAIIFSACNGNSNSTSTTDSTNTMSSSDTGMNRMNDTGMNTMNNTDTSTNRSDTANATVDKNAVDFAKEAASGGMMEVQLGNLAQKNSQNKDVQDFGKMLSDDHSSLNNDLKDLAGKKNVTLPTTVTNDQQDKIDKLTKKTGTDFDKDFLSMAVDDHEKDISKFKKAGQNIKDADFKDFIVKALPKLQKHLDKAKELKKKM